jgi:hypothetical protein
MARADVTDGAELLSPICDIDDVWGVFALGPDGSLILWDMPACISDSTLDEVAPRLVLLRDAFTGGAPDLDFCVIEYARHTLWLRAAANGMVCVVSSPRASRSALKTVMTMALRRLPAA